MAKPLDDVMAGGRAREARGQRPAKPRLLGRPPWPSGFGRPPGRHGGNGWVVPYVVALLMALLSHPATALLASGATGIPRGLGDFQLRTLPFALDPGGSYEFSLMFDPHADGTNKAADVLVMMCSRTERGVRARLEVAKTSTMCGLANGESAEGASCARGHAENLSERVRLLQHRRAGPS